MKTIPFVLSALAVMSASTTIAVVAANAVNEKAIVPFMFPTYPADICATAALDTNGADVKDLKFVAVVQNQHVIGCRLSFAPGDTLPKPPFKATFKDADGNTFTVSSDRMAMVHSGPSTTMQPQAPGGWNRVRNSDQVPANP